MSYILLDAIDSILTDPSELLSVEKLVEEWVSYVPQFPFFLAAAWPSCVVVGDALTSVSSQIADLSHDDSCPWSSRDLSCQSPSHIILVSEDELLHVLVPALVWSRFTSLERFGLSSSGETFELSWFLLIQ